MPPSIGGWFLTACILSHPGIRATQQIVTLRYFWPSINTDVRQWTHSCLQCQHSKVQNTDTCLLAPSPLQTRILPMSTLTSYVGPLLIFKGYTHLLTHWPQAIPLMDMSNTVAHGWGSTLWSTHHHHIRSGWPV